MDLDYRKQWDQYVKECNGDAVVYWQVKYPFPMSNRDVSFPKAHHYSAFEVFLCPVTITQW
eukprot:bmy_20015T0